jgi:N-methylhydantoinase B
MPVELDPITFEVLRNALVSVVDEMAVMVEKLAFSTVVSEGRDFSGAICTTDGDLVAQGDQDIPFIGGTIPYRLKALLAHVPEDEIEEGDVFLHNDPFLGGTHAQDVSAIMPVFWQGERVAFVQTCAHFPDIGGPSAGSFNPDARSTYEEGLLLPPIHIVRRGRLEHGVERLLLRNVRTPETIRGDLRSTIEACRAGEERLHALLRKYGSEVVVAEMHALIDYSERLVRAEVAKLPDGKYSWTDQIDRDPGADTDDPVTIGLDVTVAGDELVYDFSRTSPQAKSPVNVPRSAVFSASMTATKHIFPDVPLNQGILRAIRFVVPARSVISAEHPTPVSGGASGAAEKIVSCIHGCFMQVAPERAMACPTNLTNLCIGGFDPRPGYESDYVMYLWLAGGWGARPGKKDHHTYFAPLGAGTRTQPAELLEHRFPVLIEGYGLKPDSEGAGRHRGGFGLHWPLRLTHGPATLIVEGDRERFGSWGFAGGEAARGNHLVYAPGTDEEDTIGMMRGGYRIDAGRLLEYWQGGGGGWGPPDERPVEWVLEDVVNGLVSLERARDVYGVAVRVLDEEALRYEVDAGETERLRAAVRAARQRVA